MKKAPYYYILVLAFVFSCSPKNTRLEENKIKDNARKLKEFVLNDTGSGSSKLDAGMDGEWVTRIKNEKGIVMVYLINSECSTCIMDYILFLKAADKIKGNIAVYGVLNNHHEALLDYYLGEFDIESFKRIKPVHILSDSSYPFGNITDPSKNIIIINYDTNTVNRINFSNNELTLF